MNLDDIYVPTGQKVEQEYKRTCRHIEAVREHWDFVSEVKGLIANGEDDMARWLYNTIPEPIQIVLWRAPTKGGIWTKHEREVLKPNTVTEAYLSQPEGQ